MEKLAEMGFNVHVLTSGNGSAYFQRQECVRSLTATESFSYSTKNGNISGWATLKSLFCLLPVARAKRAQLEGLLDQINPDFAVVDSEYSLSPLRRRRIPIIALNTSEIVVTQYLKYRREAKGVHSHFWFVEFADYLFHKHYCDLVLSPFPLRTPTRHPKFKRIGLIARQAVLDRAAEAGCVEFPSPRQVRSVVFMLSGSIHASHIPFEKYNLTFKVQVVGRSGESSGQVTYHGRQMDNKELLAGADAIVINAGYSAVSEAFVLGKPVFVVPVPGHAEQFVNARLVRDLGLGFVATETDVLDQLLKMYQSNQWAELKSRPLSFEIDGAREAALAIRRLAAERAARGGLARSEPQSARG
jgi:hypothetical protein